MATLLICDDEAHIRTVIRYAALFDGHETEEAADGAAALALCKKEGFDLAILDVMMPELDGFSVLHAVRQFSDIPVILLSARDDEYDRIHGFEAGADDYVTKPFSPRELMLRVRAILRRTAKNQQGAEGHFLFEKEGFVADLTAYQLFIDGVPLNLSPKLYALLFFLIRNNHIAVTREKILTAVWGFDYYGDDRTLDTHMKLLRRAMGSYAGLIQTVRGVGYRFDG